MINRSSSKTKSPIKETPLEPVESRAVKATLDLYTDKKTSEQEAFTKEVTGINNLSPDVQASMKKVMSTVKKEKVNSLLNIDSEKKNKLFEVENSRTSEHQKAKVLKKISKWEASEEINVANASVVVSWLDKFAKLK